MKLVDFVLGEYRGSPSEKIRTKRPWSVRSCEWGIKAELVCVFVCVLTVETHIWAFGLKLTLQH